MFAQALAKPADGMTTGLTRCFEDQDLAEAAKMEKKHVHQLPVLDHQNRLVGIVMLDDVVGSHAKKATIAAQPINCPVGTRIAHTLCTAPWRRGAAKTGRPHEESIMSTMTEKMSKASHTPPVDEGVGSPKKGEQYRCAKCGMAIQVTADCRCQQPGMVHFHCCGQELQRA